MKICQFDSRKSCRNNYNSIFHQFFCFEFSFKTMLLTVFARNMFNTMSGYMMYIVLIEMSIIWWSHHMLPFHLLLLLLINANHAILHRITFWNDVQQVYRSCANTYNIVNHFIIWSNVCLSENVMGFYGNNLKVKCC